jgi:tetratricopeptide (TPR) repeat protein
MFHRPVLKIALALVGLAAISILAYQLPFVQRHLSWRLDLAATYVRGVIYPANDIPMPVKAAGPLSTLPPPSISITRQAPTTKPATPGAPQHSPTPTPTLPPLPASASLVPPAYERQDMNNCGPATLSLYLRYYGWKGTQFDISNLVKPINVDRNVNVEELAYYVRTRAGWLDLQYRVGGTLEVLKRVIASGMPVMIEETFKMDEVYWPNDDLWAGHYLLLTGYDDATASFITQDTFYGANRQVSYSLLDSNWKAFNRVYILVYTPDQQGTIQSILGKDWDVDTNREDALAAAQAETRANPKDAFAWFNVGTNLVYFERYDEAAQAYDVAREIGLPQRMYRYQFGPFIAYFNANRNKDLMALTEYALQRTPNSEEALVWRGWALYRQGDVNGAAASFRKALDAHPGYQDALYGLNYIGASQ